MSPSCDISSTSAGFHPAQAVSSGSAATPPPPTAPWMPVTDPDDGALVAEADVPGPWFDLAGGDTSAYCLDCHDGTCPAAGDIAEEIDDVTAAHSQFVRSTNGRNMHQSHVLNGFTCTECHNAHSNTGTQGLNRGHLLYDYITVDTFPYVGRWSCSMAGGPDGCHH